MNVSLTPELEKFVNDQVASGRYQTASEVVRDALRTLDHASALREAQLQRVRDKIAKGIAELDAGRGIPSEEAWDQVRARRTEKKSA